MLRLELTDEEARELSSALTATLHGLRIELSAAEVRQFKHDLRERLDRLEQVQARLVSALDSDETGPPDRSLPAG
jgi:hypothetical protein